MIVYMEYITLAIAICYFVTAMIIQRGMRTKYDQSTEQPKISILIAARNEEKYLPACLDSISKLNYPKHLTEVIVLDDRSDDRTGEIATEYCAKYNYIKLYRIQDSKAGLAGKMNVLSQGIEYATGEIILVTDADCVVNENWANAIVSYFTNKTGMVGGVTLLSKANTKETLFCKIQALDWLFLQGVASGSAGSGYPTSILGNNFAFRKQVYAETGGYESIGFSLTEDMVLMRAVQKLDKWQIKYPLTSETSIFSQPAKSYRQLLNQRRRWVSGGMMGPVSGWIMMTIAFLTHFLPLIFIITAKPTGLIFASLSLPIIADFLFILRPLSQKLERNDLLKYFVIFEVYYFFYTTVFAGLSFLPLKIKWKNREFK
jgi:cellulose synthase/poly-beta-1,6-N-acetylglucosamine synthase-like glycosyltransferase